MSVINTNITSMIGQSNLNKSQNALQTSMERLSSGLRINSAKDDAAGQAIANRMTAQITGLGQAQRNANDGISVAQTAEGSLNQINDNLQRIRELSVQAANGTNSQDDLTSIQDEITQRLAEIDRISEETSFNGVNVLASDQALQIQVGANDGETISVNLKEINSETLGLNNFTVSGLSAPITELSGTDANGNAVTVEVDLTGIDLANFAATDHDQLSLRSYTDAAGTTQYAIMDSDGSLAKLGEGGSAIDTDATATTFGDITDFTDAAGVTAAKEAYDTDAEAGLTATANPMATLDAALKDVDSLRSELGAVQNRFEDAITNLNTNETNLAAARSRIEDADYAVEVADMTRAQILQQAGTSVLAQANQIPQNVLSLLG
ncbi:MAG: FliC/FljB family flagellin [Halomonas sp.]|nr:FliC/FljB family flagellin [Halomonas sp.]MBR2514866.1 FliC/FljB family flagellin [Halomonas sp.]